MGSTGFWKGIIKDNLEECVFTFNDHGCFILLLDDGSIIDFWNDLWVEEESLYCRFLRINYLSIAKSSLVSAFGEWKNIFGWESDFKAHFNNILRNVTLNKESKDRIVWNFNVVEIF